jgi:hypothetical protein
MQKEVLPASAASCIASAASKTIFFWTLYRLETDTAVSSETTLSADKRRKSSEFLMVSLAHLAIMGGKRDNSA